MNIFLLLIIFSAFSQSQASGRCNNTIVCENGFFDDRICECNCSSVTCYGSSLNDTWLPMFDNCSCGGCPADKDCHGGTLSSSCECECSNLGVDFCGFGFINNTFFSCEDATCECMDHCGMFPGVPVGDNCSCECPDYTCPRGEKNSICECECSEEEEQCNGYIFPYNCSCLCVLPQFIYGGDNDPPILEGFSPIECKNGAVLNELNCSCDCSSVQCAGELTETCECYCDDISCEQWEILNYSSCECVEVCENDTNCYNGGSIFIENCTCDCKNVVCQNGGTLNDDCTCNCSTTNCSNPGNFCECICDEIIECSEYGYWQGYPDCSCNCKDLIDSGLCKDSEIFPNCTCEEMDPCIKDCSSGVLLSNCTCDCSSVFCNGELDENCACNCPELDCGLEYKDDSCTCVPCTRGCYGIREKNCGCNCNNVLCNASTDLVVNNLTCECVCPIEGHKNIGNGKCCPIDIPDNCLACNSSEFDFKCEECKEGTHLTSASDCCIEEYCATCENNLRGILSCTSCDENFNLVESMNGTCCRVGCLACSNGIDMCEYCMSGYYLRHGRCSKYEACDTVDEVGNCLTCLDTNLWGEECANPKCFKKYKPIRVTNDSGEKRGGDVLLTINTEELINVEEMLDSCKDMLFKELNRSNYFNYWIQSGCNTAETKIWVNVREMEVNETITIWMYYFCKDYDGETYKLTNDGNFMLLSNSSCPSGGHLSWKRNENFENKFIKLSNSFGIVDKNAHEHYLAGYSTSYSSDGSDILKYKVEEEIGEETGEACGVEGSHSHFIIIKSEDSDFEPPFKTSIACYSQTLEIFQGAIIAKSTKGAHTGYETVSDFDEKYIKINGTYGVEGGEMSHHHTFNDEIMESTCSHVKIFVEGAMNTITTSTHTHKMQFLSNDTTVLPEYVKLFFEINTDVEFSQEGYSNAKEDMLFFVTHIPPLGFEKLSLFNEKLVVGDSLNDSGAFGGDNSPHHHNISDNLQSQNVTKTVVAIRGIKPNYENGFVSADHTHGIEKYAFGGSKISLNTINVMLVRQKTNWNYSVEYGSDSGVETPCFPECLHGGDCLIGGKCDCDGTSYEGYYCQDPTCENCVFGKCTGVNECTCNEGYDVDLACSGPFCIDCDEKYGNCTEPYVCECVNGYNGTGCKTPICENDCNGRGECTNPGTCSCFDGKYSSESFCVEPVCHSCENGDCVSPFNCSCFENYTGDYCTVPLCFLEKGGCSHGICQLPNDCLCSSGWKGDQCEKAICMIDCNHGDCVAPDTCKCDAGWNTTQNGSCSEFICTNEEGEICNGHGKCIGPNKCDCDNGWEGDLCSKSQITGLVVSMIVLGFILIMFFIFLPPIVLVSVFIFKKQRKKLKRFENIDDINILLEEHELNPGISFRINKKMFEVDFEEIKFVKKIGQGGSTASVWLVKYRDRDLVFKCFSMNDFEDEKKYLEFENEVAVISSVSHEYVVRFFGAALKEPRVGYLMQYCVNGDVKNFLQQIYPEKTGRSYSMVGRLRLLWQISSAMKHLHSLEIIHRDLKCENVLIDSNYNVNVMDFGLSKMGYSKSDMTSHIGTSIYMAPEVVEGKDYNFKCDVFSFSIIMFEIYFLNFEPYGPTSKTFGIERKVANQDFRPTMGKYCEIPFKKLIENCWKKEPHLRFSFEEIERILKGMLDEKVELKLKFKKVGESDDNYKNVNLRESDLPLLLETAQDFIHGKVEKIEYIDEENKTRGELDLEQPFDTYSKLKSGMRLIIGGKMDIYNPSKVDVTKMQKRMEKLEKENKELREKMKLSNDHIEISIEEK